MRNISGVPARLLAAGTAVLLATGLLSAMPGTANAAPGEDCSGAYRIDKKLPNGARWTMCWQVRNSMGLVLENVSYTPRGGAAHRVLSSAALAQIHVPYDGGLTEFNDLGAFGMGTVNLTAKDCPNGELRAQKGANLLCIQTLPRGYAYKKSDFDDNGNTIDKQLQGNELVLFTATPVGWYTYINQWRFSDDGSVTPEVGATGSLSPGNFTNAVSGWPVGRGRTKFSESHSHNVFWRLDFDVEGTANNVVQQFDVAGSGGLKRTMKISNLPRETSVERTPMRFWRVVNAHVKNTDQHPVSWEVDVRDTDQYRGDHAHGYTLHDVFATQYHACEQLVADNDDGRCESSVDKFVNAESLTDPVMWVQVGFHHVPRDEDEDPMPIHWQGFKIVPRDVTAKSPLP
jgi:primary-amine oxidase